MGATCNRMLNRAVTVAGLATAAILIGNGREGVLNGGVSLSIAVDGTGATLGLAATTGDLEITIWQRMVPGGQLVPNTTKLNVTHATKVPINLTGLDAYEIVLTCSTTAVAAEDWAVNCQTQRAG